MRLMGSVLVSAPANEERQEGDSSRHGGDGRAWTGQELHQGQPFDTRLLLLLQAVVVAVPYVASHVAGVLGAVLAEGTGEAGLLAALVLLVAVQAALPAIPLAAVQTHMTHRTP